jgi:hypothetical protein
MTLFDLIIHLRKLSELALKYESDYLPSAMNGLPCELKGFSHSTLTLAVHKETQQVEFAQEQAAFMLYLGSDICPRILSIDDTSYVMEYLQPVPYFTNTIEVQEMLLNKYVWNKPLSEAPFTKQIGDESWRQELQQTIGVTVPNWALDKVCLIHGDPTIDNTLVDRKNHMKIADPIPPHRLLRPSIRAVDHGKMLQSLLGWEVVLRGMNYTFYSWPKFMQDFDVAKRAVFWAMVALKRIALRDNKSNAGLWAEHIGKELEQCVSLF